MTREELIVGKRTSSNSALRPHRVAITSQRLSAGNSVLDDAALPFNVYRAWSCQKRLGTIWRNWRRLNNGPNVCKLTKILVLRVRTWNVIRNREFTGQHFQYTWR